MAHPKRTTLGVEIGHGEVRIVKAAQISSDRWRLLACVSIPFDPGLSRDDSRFHEFLRSSVSAVAGSFGKCDLWTLVSPANLDARYMMIPKVPKAQIPNAVYWTVKRETNFNESENILDFEVQGDVSDKGIAKIGIMVYLIPSKDLDEIRDLFSRSGLTVRGITVVPFAIQNLFRSGCTPRHEKPVGVLYIGDEYSRIDVFSKGNLVLTRSIRAGIGSMIEAFAEETDEQKWQVAGEACEKFLTASENEALDRSAKAEALLTRIFSEPCGPDESIGPTDLPEEAVMEMIKPALGRLARQVERTFEHSSTALQNEKVERIYVCCAAGHWARPFRFIAEQLSAEREIIDPLGQGAFVSDEVIAPATLAGRVPFIGAVGLALSDNAWTPNLIFTYRDKEKLGKITRINRGIFCAFLAAVLVLTGVFFQQERLAARKAVQASQLQKELDSFSPQPDQTTIAALAAKWIAQQRELAESTDRFLGVAVIGELISLTPPNVRLLGVRAVLGGKPDEGDKKNASAGAGSEPAEMKKEAKKGLVVEGIVTGRRDAQEASLAGYLVKLSASRIFVHPVVSSNTIESYPDEGEILRFSLQIGLP